MNSFTNIEILKAVRAVKQAPFTLAGKNLLRFTRKTLPDFEETPFHNIYYKILNLFAMGKIKKLVITVPPQHGKSEGSSRRLPAYMLGKNPDLRVGIVSYGATFALRFNRAVQRIIDSEDYRLIFPGTRIGEQRVATLSDQYIRTSSEFEIVGRKGSLISAGRGGAITGNPIDVIIMDDLYKDYAEANSPNIRENVWDFYVNSIKTRLHNNSQELIVFTRWHEDDLIGRIAKKEPMIEMTKMCDLVGADPDAWVKVNFEGIKESPLTTIDKREFGESLWENRHSLKSLENKRSLDKHRFDCLYQGNPGSREGMLYKEFETYKELPATFGNGNYTDTADSGDSFTCSISYKKSRDKIYVTDIVYTQEDMEETEILVPMMLDRSDTRYAYIESNAGGRFFAKKIQARTRAKIKWFYQSGNKESRILTNSATVNESIILPYDWEERWPVFAQHVKGYKRLFSANQFHDAPDVLTGIVEKEIFAPKKTTKRRS